MSGMLSDWQATDLVGYLATTEWWAALCTADPMVGSPTAHEFAGGSYARVKLEMAPVGARVLRAGNAAVWAGLPAGAVAYLALFTAPVGGSLRASIPLDNPYTVEAGTGYQVPADTIYVSF